MWRFGTTVNGGRYNQGTVFNLTPPAAGETGWTENVLYSFQGGLIDGANPYAGLIMDASGTLYGTTAFGGGDCRSQPDGCGTVFQLVP